MYNYQPYPSMYTAYSTAPKSEVVRVNGRNGAEAYQMAPNSSVLLLDETAPIVWLKVTDGASYPTLTPYEIKPYEVKEVTATSTQIEELKERIEKLEEKINEQSNVASIKPKRIVADKE